MKAEEFFATAGDLLVSRKREADWRSCISRAYYALYLMLGVELLRSIPLIVLQNHSICHTRNHISHEKLPRALKRSSDAFIRGVGDDLEDLRLARIKADYDLSHEFSWEHASKTFSHASKLKQNVERFGISKIMNLLRTDLEKTS